MTFTLVPDALETASATEVRAPVPSASASREEVVVSASGQATRHMVAGTSALGLGLVIERGAGFVANILAARLGGASTFGAYSLAITTANNMATYAGAGIGSTAARFSGKYPYGSSSYRTLARVLLLVSIVSAAAASLGLWLGAGPIARLLGKTDLIHLLHWAALSAAGIVLLECARGFFVGQRRLAALVLLSLIVGAGMLSLLPLAALHHSPVWMITVQGAITTMAVLTCILLARPLGLLPPSIENSQRNFGTVLREVWSFGFVQLAGLAGANAAGWWLISLVARADTSFVQMGFFGIASQLRNIVGLAPGLLTEGSLAVMADPDGEMTRTPHRVLGLTTFASSLVSFIPAGIGILIAPWMLRLLYTAAYSRATVTVSVALALAVMHMGNAPAAARLSIVSIRASGIINTVWAVFVAAVGTLFLLHGGTAAMAMAIYLGAHSLSSILVLATLAHKESLPEGVGSTFSLATASSAALAGLAAVRASHPQAMAILTGLMTLLFIAALAGLIALGHRYRRIPTRAALGRMVSHGKTSLQRLLRRRAHAV